MGRKNKILIFILAVAILLPLILGEGHSINILPAFIEKFVDDTAKNFNFEYYNHY
jgi:hypothetical protein